MRLETAKPQVFNLDGDTQTVSFRSASIPPEVLDASAKKDANLSDLTNATTARTNLGLGNAATKNTGTTAGTVATGDDSRITGSAQKSSNLSDLASASTARTNLGLGAAAVKGVGTTSSDVAAGNDIRLNAVVTVGPASGGDDTATIQAALNALTTGATMNFTSGQTYKVTNLVIPNVAYLRINLNGSTIRAFGGGSPGDSSYLIATYNWVNNVTSPGAEMCQLFNGKIIGSSTSTANEKVNGLVLMASRFTTRDLDVSYCSGAAIRQDAQTKNGSNVTANVVENRYIDNRLHESGYGFYSNDPSATYRNTDGYFKDVIAFNCTQSNLYWDKLSGWEIVGAHTYQDTAASSGMGTAFTPGTGWDMNVPDVGAGAAITSCRFESGCVLLKGFTQTHDAVIKGNFFGFSAPSGALVRIEGVSDTALSLDGNRWAGPTGANTYCSLYLVGPVTGTPFRVYINGGHFGFRAPISWAQRVAVFTSNVTVMQIGQKVPADLVLTGPVPTSGARPPGKVHRAISPTVQALNGGALGTETFVVDDQWGKVGKAVAGTAGSQYVVMGAVCVTAGSPGTWAELRMLTGT